MAAVLALEGIEQMVIECTTGSGSGRTAGCCADQSGHDRGGNLADRQDRRIGDDGKRRLSGIAVSGSNGADGTRDCTDQTSRFSAVLLDGDLSRAAPWARWN